MVRVTTWLCRVPVIKFKKGGLAHPAVSPAAAAAAVKPGSCPAFASPAAAQPAVQMSTIPDIDLPARYRRQPLSQEEIDHINGGGEELQLETRSLKAEPKMLGMIKIPKGVLVTGKRGAEAINLNIILQKQESCGMKKY